MVYEDILERLKKQLGIYYLNHLFLFNLTSGEDLILGDSSTLPLIIIKGTIAHNAKNNIQNK